MRIRPATFAPAFLVATLMFALPRTAEAIPVFANGQGGVSCVQCHSAPPNLNAYGRYILATNFTKGLDPHGQMEASKRDPVSIEVDAIRAYLADPTLPKVYLDGRFLAGGYLGGDVTYYASVPVVQNGFPSREVDQLWTAYNGFSSHNGSLQVGKFPTPIFAPWLSQSLSLSNYALASMPVGLNTIGVGDNRWGIGYTQIGRKGLIGNLSYVTNTGAVERAFDSALATGGEGQAYVGSLQFMGPTSHFTGGVAAMSGTFPLPSGAKDVFSREMALVSYSTSPKYALNAMALVGHDNDPNDGASAAASSKGWSSEAIYSPLDWLHLNLRYERTDDGLGTIGNNYVGDVAFSIMPNLILTLENVSAVGAKPVTGYRILWAGPWLHRAPAHAVAASDQNARAPSALGSPQPQASPDGRRLFLANCSACHGASGTGGVGPNLHGLAARQPYEATVGFIERPAGAIMPKLYPATLSDAEVRSVATYLRETFR